jgi:CYTH domain-containing protein
MPIDATVAKALGWPKLTYAALERERRWLCDDVPAELARHGELITDLYIIGTRLRLREAVPFDGGEPLRRLTRKADIDNSTRLLTSIYLAAGEFELLSALPGKRIRKTRYRLEPMAGVAMSIDRFADPLDGLVLAEAEFRDDASMAAFPTPAFAVREVTDDGRYSGGSLALNGAPGRE